MSDRKRDFPLDQCRCHLETGPVVLVGSQWQETRNLMVMGWHMMLGFTPAHFGCLISPGNYSYRLIRESRECTINVPTRELADAVVGVGNSKGYEVDKFAAFGLTPEHGECVSAPTVAECYASFECRLADDSQIDRHELFIWEIVKAHVDPTVERPKTLHYRGNGRFMIAGEEIDRAADFRDEML
ncbi:flavin reductase family protein [Salinicola avicenniae]|uniref:flavin reductase family protein n=1 Tax=Salinicola avicenniae TaxID=2916836 RepID=UPI002073CDD7|nr:MULTISPECIES: flavin reductase family protein [unclassified Salinicola]